jgi:hypothetical protein
MQRINRDNPLTLSRGANELYKNNVSSERSLTISDQARTGVVPNPNGPGTITTAIAPVIQPFLPLFPVANGTDNGDGTAFYNFSGAQTGKEYYAVGKVDFNLSPKTILSTSYQWDTSSLVAL